MGWCRASASGCRRSLRWRTAATTASFADYKIPTVADLPELRTVLLDEEQGGGWGPYQVKGIGEQSNSQAAPAIANAVADAVGVRIRDLPVTAEKVYRALHAQ